MDQRTLQLQLGKSATKPENKSLKLITFHDPIIRRTSYPRMLSPKALVEWLEFVPVCSWTIYQQLANTDSHALVKSADKSYMLLR